MSVARWTAPGLSASVLVAMLAIGSVSLAHPDGLGDYQQRVRDAVAGIDYRVNGWIGLDVEPTPAARALLRPNVLFQRQYTKDGHDVALLIVHCGDVRDMQGHYPPICYPAHGWTLRSRTDRRIKTGEGGIPARDYVFTRSFGGRTQRLRVTQFFVLPGHPPIHRTIDAIRAASRSPIAAGLGAGQVQLITGESMTDEQWERTLETFAEEIRPVLLAIGEGIHGER